MKNVLFVCIGNCCRSQMAEGFARHLGGDIINAASAGLSPTPHVASDTIATMAELDIDITDQFPKEFDYRLADRFDLIVNMSGFDLPEMENAQVIEWVVRDPFYEDANVFREVRNDIGNRVLNLIADVRQHGTSSEALVGSRIAPAKTRKPGLWQRITARL